LRRGLEQRLARLVAAVKGWVAGIEIERETHAARQAVAMAIRAGLAAAGIDPAEAVALRRFEAPEPPAPRAAEPGAVSDRDRLFDELRRLARRLRDDPPQSLALASPAELLALCCFGDGVADTA
jgi:hypothetical protein